MICLTMEMCQRITDIVVNTAMKDGGKPVAVAICDHTGTLVSLIKMDGTPLRSIHFARHKAYTAVRMQTRTADFLARLTQENLDIRFFCDPDLTPLPGGTPIIDGDGSVIGAVGISGRASQQDQDLADTAAVFGG